MACFKRVPLYLTKYPTIKLFICEGTTTVLKHRRRIIAKEIMFEFPHCVVCHADSFFLGRPIPILTIHDHLLAGHSYFVLPLDRLPPLEAHGGALSAALLSSLGSLNPDRPRVSGIPLIKFSGSNNDGNNTNEKSPFEYIKDKEGRMHVIKIVPEFIKMIIVNNSGLSSSNCDNNSNSSLICSTPELQKQYKQLVKAKDQGWSPKLETIYEHRKSIRFSTCKFIVLKWKKKKV